MKVILVLVYLQDRIYIFYVGYYDHCKAINNSSLKIYFLSDNNIIFIMLLAVIYFSNIIFIMSSTTFEPAPDG